MSIRVLGHFCVVLFFLLVKEESRITGPLGLKTQ